MRLEDNRDWHRDGGGYTREISATRFWMECTLNTCRARGPVRSNSTAALEAAAGPRTPTLWTSQAVAKKCRAGRADHLFVVGYSGRSRQCRWCRAFERVADGGAGGGGQHPTSNVQHPTSKDSQGAQREVAA